MAMGVVAPATGSISDIFGRRYIALFGPVLVFVGMMIIGLTTQSRIGMGFAGVGASFSGITAIFGISEIVPMKQRGLYLGMAFLFVLPFGASNEFGLTNQNRTDGSSIVFFSCNLEMGILDLSDRMWTQLCRTVDILLPSITIEFYNARTHLTH
jgi:hypothetical protein